MKNTSILSRFQNEVAMLNATQQPWFEHCVHAAAEFLVKMEKDQGSTQVAASGFWYSEDDWQSAYRPYDVQDGILRIPVRGVMLNGYPWATQWATGYEYILEAMKRGMADPDVKGIALIIDSPGGMVSGNFDLVDDIFGMRGTKPIRAYASDSAYSAAYSIASAADTITVTRSGGVGSVGVVTMHVDMSAAMEKYGYKITFIYRGKHKTDGNPYEALPDDVRDRIQARIDSTYSEFVGIVARNRGMDEGAVRKTEALTYSAQEALDIGFADKIGRTDSEITAFAATFNQRKDEAMADNNEAQTITTEDVNKARAEGATAERTRISAILGSDEAKKRPTIAMKFALNEKFASLDAAAVNEMLGSLPEEKQEQPAQEKTQAATTTAGAGVQGAIFDAAMAATQPGHVSTDGKTTEGGTKTEADQAAEDRALRQAAGLAGFNDNTK